MVEDRQIFAFAWDMISASDIVPDGFLFNGGDEGGVGCGTIPNDADAAEGAGLGVGALATSGMANGGACGSFGRSFGFDGGDAWGASPNFGTTSAATGDGAGSAAGPAAGSASGAGSTLLLMMSRNIGGVILRIASSPHAPCISIAPFIASFIIYCSHEHRRKSAWDHTKN